MRAITVFRAMAWLGVAVVFWSLNMRWGTDAGLPKGPPVQWERTVVGAGLLALLVAMTLSVSGRKGNPPGWPARGIATAASALVLVIAWHLRSEAVGPFADWIHGKGWTWLVAGSGLVGAATLGSLALGAPRNEPKVARKRRGHKSR